MSQDLGELLQSNSLHIVANGFHGHTDETRPISVTKLSNGSYKFSGQIHFDNEPMDQIAGNIKGRHIVFTRTRPGGFVQKYDGRVFEKVYREAGEMAGKVTSDGRTEWGWYGWLQALGLR